MQDSFFRETLLPLKKKLFRYAYRLLNDYEDAGDAVQDAYLKLWEQRNKLDDINNHEAFSVTVTRNICLDKLKSKKNISLTENIKDSEWSLEHKEQELIDKQKVALIKKLVNQLPDLHREIMILKDFEGYDYDEIAEILNISVNNIRVNLSRSRKKIREMYLNTVSHGIEKN